MVDAGHVQQPMRWRRQGSSITPSAASSERERMFTAAFFIALTLSALAALPGDWARRNSTPRLATGSTWQTARPCWRSSP